MGYPFGKPMFDFLAAPENPDLLMNSLERFIEFWFGSRDPEYGVSDAKLQSFQLPVPLRRFYAFAGQWPTPNHFGHLFTWQDRITPFEYLRIEDEKLVFVWENQGVWRCGTKVAGADPPVWVRTDDDSDWIKVCDSLAQFLVTFVLAESVYGSKFKGYGASMLQRFSERDARIVPVWLNGPYAGFPQGAASQAGCGRRSIHLVNGSILVLNDASVGTQNEGDVEMFADIIRSSTTTYQGKEPFWDDASVISGWPRKQMMEILAKRHARQAEQHEELGRQHRLWEQFFQDTSKKPPS